MMRLRVTRVAVVIVSVLLVHSTLWAQSLVDEVPPEYEEPVEEWETEEEMTDSPFHKQRFLDDAISERIRLGKIVDVTSELISLFEARDWGENEIKQQKILNQLQRFLGAVKVAFRTQGIEGALDLKAEQNLFLNALNDQEFGLESLKMETVQDAGGSSVSGYFDESDDKLVLFEYVEIQGEEKIRLLLTQEQVREWRLLEDALSNLLVKQIALVSVANIKALSDAVIRWENILDKGYSQMPWESLVNGWLIEPPGFPELGPPDHQWIFLHPTLGLELSTNPIKETRVKEVMHIELLGHIWYRGEQLHDFSGLSLAASLREDLDPGIGLMFHIKRNWSIGVSWRDLEEDPFLFFSVDLFRFAKQNGSKYMDKYEQARAQIGID